MNFIEKNPMKFFKFYTEFSTFDDTSQTFFSQLFQIESSVFYFVN